MNEEQQDYQEIEEADEEGRLYVVDPEDYQQTKKLESIHKARERVRKVRADDPGRTSRKEWKAYHARLSRAVADYANEMMVLIEHGIENGVLDEDAMIIETPKGPLNLRNFVLFDGADTTKVKKGKVEEGNQAPSAKPGMSMLVYRRLDKILNELGLGLEFDEDKGPAELEL